MNNICLTGRLTREPELRTTSTGKNVCEFTLAVNRDYANAEGKREADFIACQVWGKQAENLCKYQGKGSQINVLGSLRVDKYQNEQGENRYRTYVLASYIEYLGSKSTTDNDEEVEDPFADIGEEVEILTDDDELPF